MPEKRAVSFRCEDLEVVNDLKQQLDDSIGKEFEQKFELEYDGFSRYSFLAENPRMANIIFNFLLSKLKTDEELVISEVQIFEDISE